MTRYFAFLRAINVTGRRVKMDRLRGLLRELGYANVESFIASGNLIFESESDDTAALEEEIEAQLGEQLGYPVATFIRTRSELVRVARRDPFGETGTDRYLSVGFLGERPSRKVASDLRALTTDVDLFDVRGREIYWLVQADRGTTRLSGARLERLLGGPVTFRNVATAHRLIDKYAS